jgi:hypothetical protein
VIIERKSAWREKKEVTVSLMVDFTSPTVSLIEFSVWDDFFFQNILYGENRISDPIPKTTKAIASNLAFKK